MLARFKIYMRQKRPPHDPLPAGRRIQTQYRHEHCTSPSEEMVKKYLDDPSSAAWEEYEREYFSLLESRFQERREEFDELAALARSEDVFMGCTCPTQNNPNVWHCHTVLALKFMEKKYPDLRVVFPVK